MSRNHPTRRRRRPHLAPRPPEPPRGGPATPGCCPLCLGPVDRRSGDERVQDRCDRNSICDCGPDDHGEFLAEDEAPVLATPSARPSRGDRPGRRRPRGVRSLPAPSTPVNRSALCGRANPQPRSSLSWSTKRNGCCLRPGDHDVPTRTRSSLCCLRVASRAVGGAGHELGADMVAAVAPDLRSCRRAAGFRL